MPQSTAKPAFWKWEEWSALWPPAAPLVQPSFDVSLCSQEFQQRWRSDAAVLAVMLDQAFNTPVTIATARAVANRMDAWTHSNSVENTLTLPPTLSAFHRALQSEIETNGHNVSFDTGTVALLFAQIRPHDIGQALRQVSVHQLSADWQKIKDQIVSVAPETVSAPVETTSPAPAEKPVSAKRVNKSPDFKRDLPVRHHEDGQRIVGWLQEIESASATAPLSVQKQMMNKFIKSHATEAKGLGDQAINYWFEDVAFPALCTLTAEQLKKVLDVWPDHTQVTWNSPTATMSNPVFWRALRSLKNPARTVLLEEVLPQLINTENWNTQERFAMLQQMVERTKEYGWLFEERLKLWCAWGGDLDLEVPTSTEQAPSMFSPVSTQSARQWLMVQDISVWKNVLDNKFPPIPPKTPRGP